MDLEEIKTENPIEDVIEQCGYSLERKHGKYIRAPGHGGLVINTAAQLFYWNEKNWHGDVISWVEKHFNYDFRAAVEWLCRRANLAEPKWTEKDEVKARAAREREEAWEVATRVFHRWLLKDEEALGYVKGRGWTDETIQECVLGFSGRRDATAFEDMRGEFALYGIEADSPQAVCILGYKGDIKKWGEKWDIDVSGTDWLGWGMIPGAMGKKRLVYPHWYMGRVRYFTTRTLFDDREIENGKEIKKSWNPPALLGGAKFPYFNQEFGRVMKEVVIVEGPADAVSLGQWGIPAVALCGIAAGNEQMIKLADQIKGAETIYVALDGDIAGRGNAWRVAEALGPMTRLVEWPENTE